MGLMVILLTFRGRLTWQKLPKNSGRPPPPPPPPLPWYRVWQHKFGSYSSQGNQTPAVSQCQESRTCVSMTFTRQRVISRCHGFVAAFSTLDALYCNNPLIQLLKLLRYIIYIYITLCSTLARPKLNTIVSVLWYPILSCIEAIPNSPASTPVTPLPCIRPRQYVRTHWWCGVSSRYSMALAGLSVSQIRRL